MSDLLQELKEAAVELGTKNEKLETINSQAIVDTCLILVAVIHCVEDRRRAMAKMVDDLTHSRTAKVPEVVEPPPISTAFRAWLENPCHGRIAAGFEFATLVKRVEDLEKESKGRTDRIEAMLKTVRENSYTFIDGTATRNDICDRVCRAWAGT